jgi:hypothetical protein
MNRGILGDLGGLGIIASFKVMYSIFMEVLTEASVIWYPEQSFEQRFFQKKRQKL